MNDINPEALVPNIVMKDSVKAEGDGYYVELGEQRFTQQQWELVQLYARGVAELAEAEAKDEKTLDWGTFHDITHEERLRQLAKGYDAAHDDKHGIYHLLTQMQIKLREGDKPAVAGLLQAAREYLVRNPERRSASMQDMVKHFHEGMGQPVGLAPHPLPQHRVPVRVELIREEFQDELVPALLAGDLVETVDAAIDILYVTFGLLVEMGVNAYPVFAEVQRSNMSKFGEDGMAIIAGPNDPDGIFPGRVKKGPNYFKPNLKAVLLSGEADLG